VSSEIPESQTLNAKGRKFDAQVVIEILEKMQIDFYPDGNAARALCGRPLFTPERMLPWTRNSRVI